MIFGGIVDVENVFGVRGVELDDLMVLGGCGLGFGFVPVFRFAGRSGLILGSFGT